MTKKHEKKSEKTACADEKTAAETVNNSEETAVEKSETECACNAADSKEAQGVKSCGASDANEAIAEQTPAAEKGGETPETQKAPPSETEKIEALETKCKELQDQYLRKAADFDNYRKRMIREKQEAIDYANTNLLSDLLQILDDFDRAIEAGGKPEEGSPAAAFAQGVVMIKNSLLSLLESKYGLQYYEVQGKVFDPEIHEAVATNPSSDVTEPTVGAELQKGYKLKDRILRSAKVMVLMPKPAEEK